MSNGIDVIGIGELLWDCFPDERRPGGAPANVAFHAQQLGLSAAVATRVGTDELGRELIAFLERQGLSTSLVQQDAMHGTGTVTVTPRGTATEYVFLPDSAWDFLTVDSRCLAAMATARAVCFGTLAQRGEVSRRSIHELVAATSPTCLRVYDINVRAPYCERSWIEASLRLATIVKLNDDEVRLLAEMFSAPSGDIAFAQWLQDAYQLDLVCVTRGRNGAVAVTVTEVAEVSGVLVQVADTVGAGDAFTAGLIWTRLQGWGLDRGLRFANQVGALVASRSGAMPDLQKELADLMSAHAM